MKKPIAFLKFKSIFFIIITCFALGCESNDNGTISNGSVLLSSPNFEVDNTMALNSSVSFNATIDSIDESEHLAYSWSIASSKGRLVADGQMTQNTTLTVNNSIEFRGDEPGLEIIRVEVINADTGDLLAQDTLEFEILEGTGLARCFNESVLFLSDGISNRAIIHGIESGNRSSLNAPTVSVFTDMALDGTTYLRQDFTDTSDIEIYLESCNPAVEGTLLVDEGQTELPTFGPDGLFVYYSKELRVENKRTQEIFRHNIQTGEDVMITNTGFFSGKPIVSPDGEWILFEQSEERFDANGFNPIVHLAIIPSAGGSAQLLFEIDFDNFRLGGYDWAPDSNNIIFYIDAFTSDESQITEGIYNIRRIGGNPFLLFSDGPDTSSIAHNLGYYDKGNRIAFERGGDIWSMDANGNDLQLLFDEGFVFLSFIWEP